MIKRVRMGHFEEGDRRRGLYQEGGNIHLSKASMIVRYHDKTCREEGGDGKEGKYETL